MYAHALYTGTIPQAFMAGSYSAGSVKTGRVGHAGAKPYDYAGELPAPSTQGTRAVLGQDVETDPGSGFGHAGRTGAIYCGEEVA